jgi:flavin reductase (DIM6/NTAB) family NADH-FMN oxidoreductase RutF
MVISPDEFRQALGHFATGVTVVTTSDGDGRPTGLTASAFTSVSLDPPLVLVCVDHKSQSYPALRERGRFAVNILRRDQQAVSRRFASTRLDKFDEVPFHVSAIGLPLIDAALAQLECVTVSMHVEGDHTIFVGRVERAHVGAGEPLVYYRGLYDRLSTTRSGRRCSRRSIRASTSWAPSVASSKPSWRDTSGRSTPPSRAQRPPPSG